MNVSMEDLGTGWFDIGIGLTDADITRLIERLQSIQQKRAHFHLRRDDFSPIGGIADIEIYWTDEAPENMSIE